MDKFILIFCWDYKETINSICGPAERNFSSCSFRDLFGNILKGQHPPRLTLLVSEYFHVIESEESILRGKRGPQPNPEARSGEGRDLERVPFPGRGIVDASLSIEQIPVGNAGGDWHHRAQVGIHEIDLDFAIVLRKSVVSAIYVGHILLTLDLGI